MVVRRYREPVPDDAPTELTESLPPVADWRPHTSDALTESWLVGEVRIVVAGPLGPSTAPDRATASSVDDAGRLWFEPVPEDGTRFSFSLPRLAAA